MSALFEAEVRSALRTCDEQSTRALADVLRAMDALEDLPEVMSCDRENDARWGAIEALRAAFVCAYRIQFAAQRALDMVETMSGPQDISIRDGALESGNSAEMTKISQLVELADRIVRESGDSENFDAAVWVADWLDVPHPALGGKSPRDFLDTEDGFTRLSNLLLQQQASTYV